MVGTFFGWHDSNFRIQSGCQEKWDNFELISKNCQSFSTEMKLQKDQCRSLSSLKVFRQSHWESLFLFRYSLWLRWDIWIVVCVCVGFSCTEHWLNVCEHGSRLCYLKRTHQASSSTTPEISGSLWMPLIRSNWLCLFLCFCSIETHRYAFGTTAWASNLYCIVLAWKKGSCQHPHTSKMIVFRISIRACKVKDNPLQIPKHHVNSLSPRFPRFFCIICHLGFSFHIAGGWSLLLCG